MRLLERYATGEPYSSPGCKIIAVNTLNKRRAEYNEGKTTMWRKMEEEDRIIKNVAPVGK